MTKYDIFSKGPNGQSLGLEVFVFGSVQNCTLRTLRFDKQNCTEKKEAHVKKEKQRLEKERSRLPYIQNSLSRTEVWRSWSKDVGIGGTRAILTGGDGCTVWGVETSVAGFSRLLDVRKQPTRCEKTTMSLAWILGAVPPVRSSYCSQRRHGDGGSGNKYMYGVLASSSTGVTSAGKELLLPAAVTPTPRPPCMLSVQPWLEAPVHRSGAGVGLGLWRVCVDHARVPHVVGSVRCSGRYRSRNKPVTMSPVPVSQRPEKESVRYYRVSGPLLGVRAVEVTKCYRHLDCVFHAALGITACSENEYNVIAVVGAIVISETSGVETRRSGREFGVVCGRTQPRRNGGISVFLTNPCKNTPLLRSSDLHSIRMEILPVF